MFDLNDGYHDEINAAKAWYLSRSVYAATAIGFWLGFLVTWVF